MCGCGRTATWVLVFTKEGIWCKKLPPGGCSDSKRTGDWHGGTYPDVLLVCMQVDLRGAGFHSYHDSLVVYRGVFACVGASMLSLGAQDILLALDQPPVIASLAGEYSRCPVAVMQ